VDRGFGGGGLVGYKFICGLQTGLGVVGGVPVRLWVWGLFVWEGFGNGDIEGAVRNLFVCSFATGPGGEGKTGWVTVVTIVPPWYTKWGGWLGTGKKIKVRVV